MKRIKTKESSNDFIKKLDKNIARVERIKDPVVYNIKQLDNSITEDDDINSYGENKIEYEANRLKDETIYSGRKIRNSIKDKTNMKRKNIKSTKIYSSDINKGNLKVDIKKTKEKKILKERIKKYAINIYKESKEIAKKVGKATVNSIKNIIKSTKALIVALCAGGWLSVIVVLVICLVGLLCSSIFGIFLSSEDKGDSSITMDQVIKECNDEFSNRILNIQNTNPHEEYILKGNMAEWKDILMVYTAIESNGLNEHDVVILDINKKNKLKEIFWNMNSITYEVKQDNVIEQGTNIDQKPTSVLKNVLYVYINNKSIEDMKKYYRFNPMQNRQLEELKNQQYDPLWNGVIYGNHFGKFQDWKQKGEVWSSIRVGNTSQTLGDLGCLITSVAILIEYSGVDNPLVPFNPGIFVEALNNNGGFDSRANLQYAAINRVVPDFKYVGNVNLRGKTQNEKLYTIQKYLNDGYFIAAEVKGATQNSQHWVAVLDIKDGRIIMSDPGSSHKDLWRAYEYSKTSQFVYFKRVK